MISDDLLDQEAKAPHEAGAAQAAFADYEQRLAGLSAIKETDALLRARAETSKITVCDGRQIQVGTTRYAEREQQLRHQGNGDTNLLQRLQLMQQLEQQSRQSVVIALEPACPVLAILTPSRSLNSPRLPPLQPKLNPPLSLFPTLSLSLSLSLSLTPSCSPNS